MPRKQALFDPHDNPLMKGMTIPYTKRQVAKMLEDEDGEPYTVHVEVHSELRWSTKLYRTAALRKLYVGLSGNAARMFLYMTCIIERGSVTLTFNKKKFIAESGLSMTTVNVCLKELESKEVIARTGFKDVYWLSPKFFFFGEPLNYLNDFIDYPYEKTENE